MNHKIHILTNNSYIYSIVPDLYQSTNILHVQYLNIRNWVNHCYSGFPCPSEDGLFRPKHVKDIRS
jgi:hypothetical protein